MKINDLKEAVRKEVEKMPSKPVKKPAFKEVLVAKIDEYMDKAFETTDADMRQKYRDAIREMQKLLVIISELE